MTNRNSAPIEPILKVSIRGGATEQESMERILEAILEEAVALYRMDQSDLDVVGELIGLVARDVKRGVRTSFGWSALSALAATIALEDNEFPVPPAKAWFYLASLRGMFAGLPEG